MNCSIGEFATQSNYLSYVMVAHTSYKLINTTRKSEIACHCQVYRETPPSAGQTYCATAQ